MNVQPKFAYSTQLRESLSLAVYNTGYEKCSSSYCYGPAVRDHFVIHYVVSGKGTAQFGDKQYDVSAHSVFLMCPGQPCVYTADSQEPWEYYWVSFSGIEAERLLNLTGINSENPVAAFSAEDHLENFLLEIYRASGNQPSNETRMTGRLYLFFARLIEVNEAKRTLGSSNFDYIEKAVKFVMFNYSRNIDVCNIAEYAGISRSHLYRLFIRHLNIPPNEYLTRFRINEACALLRKGELSVGEIAYSVGFSDPLYFSRVFKKVKGIAPSSYIREIGKAGVYI